MNRYVQDLLHTLGGFVRVSVVVPNYNYARYLKARLATIFDQSYPIYEIIVLDDASTDDSLPVIEAELAAHKEVESSVLRNHGELGLRVSPVERGNCPVQRRCRLGSPKRTILADPGFLAALAPAFAVDPRLVLAYSQSRQINEAGVQTADNYLEYTSDVSDIWRGSYEREGAEEIAEAMAIKTVIPNVSAALFRRSTLVEALDELGRSRHGVQTGRATGWCTSAYCAAAACGSSPRRSMSIAGTTAASPMPAMPSAISRKSATCSGSPPSMGAPSPEVEAKAKDYLFRLSRQLGLDSLAAPVSDEVG